MRNFFCMITIFAICLSLCACGNNANNDISSNDKNTSQNSEVNESTDSNSSELIAYEIYGYKYCFPSQVLQSGASDGSLFKCNDCSIFVYKFDDLSFTSWETVVEDYQTNVFKAFSTAFRFYPEEQEVKSSAMITNSNGEELLRVSGNFILSDGTEKREFITYYHLTQENKVRFFVGISESNSEELADTVDFVADNLSKLSV